jgi:hypothetical protein
MQDSLGLYTKSDEDARWPYFIFIKNVKGFNQQNPPA